MGIMFLVSKLLSYFRSIEEPFNTSTTNITSDHSDSWYSSINNNELKNHMKLEPVNVIDSTDNELLNIIYGNNKDWTVFGIPKCPFTIRAVNYLKEKGYQIEFVDVSNMREMLTDLIGGEKRVSVPQVFIKRGYIGGCDNLMDMFGE